MVFEFNNQYVPQSLIEVDEIGEFALEARNDDGYYWYLIIKTFYGTAVIATCGPVIPDLSAIPAGYTAFLDKIPYKEDKLEKIISRFLNDPKKALTKAEEISIDEAKKQFKEIYPYLENFDGDSF